MTLPDRDTTAQGLLAAFVLLTFLMGGSARDDVLSLLLLRPLAAFAFVAGLFFLTARTFRANRGLILAAFAYPLLMVLHLVPLPPGLWQALPGRELGARIDEAVGLSGTWRPLSIAPFRTVNALFASMVPLAGLLLALSLPRAKLVATLNVGLAAVLLTAVLGLLQTTGGVGSGFFLYRITNDGSAVGLFANRNHSAMFLALTFPLIAAKISLMPGVIEQVRPREWFASGVAVLLIPFILATESRAGIVIGLLGLALGWWTYRSPAEGMQSRRGKLKFDPRLLFGALAAATLVGLTVLLTASNSVQRLASFGKYGDELRLRVWGPIWQMALDFFPFGSGIGTFIETFMLREGDDLLKPTYLNHAHNDWLELLLTGGLPAVLVVLVGGAVLLRGGLAALASERRSRLLPLRRLGLAVVIVLALASFYDYPLRVPSLGLLFALGAVWLAGREGAGTPAGSAAPGDPAASPGRRG